VPDASRALDSELRAELGAPDPGLILVARGPDPESVLRQQEALLPLLDRLTADGELGSADAAARLLPSEARQRARQERLPDPDMLRTQLDQARAGLPFRADAFAGFLDAVASSRTLAPLRLADLQGTPLAARLEPLLTYRGGEWRGPIILRDVAEPVLVVAAMLEAQSRVVFIDTRAELGRLLSAYTARAWRWLGWSGALMLIVLAAGLRSIWMAARVIASVLAAMLVTVALLTALGAEFSLIHLVALQLVAGVGLDYALFFARRQLDGEERARTMRTLVTCNAMTLLTFGLLALCRTPLLRDIGMTVACGAVLAMVFAFFGTGEAPAR